ncbi:hypothetical protein BaRGS_00014706 [Batillaria attramentaria]|uniref:Uncharacterized protein n=1 Tax=Batillaria attramentaria TaxID=370345 RepID=A0ABD0L3F5_9CAEN
MGRVKIIHEYILGEEIVYKVYTGKAGRPKIVRRPFKAATSTAVSDSKRQNVGSSTEFDQKSSENVAPPETLAEQYVRMMNQIAKRDLGRKAFPYKDVSRGMYAVSGVPSECLPLKKVASVGRRKLKLLLKSKIKIWPVAATVVPGISESVETSASDRRVSTVAATVSVVPGNSEPVGASTTDRDFGQVEPESVNIESATTDTESFSVIPVVSAPEILAHSSTGAYLPLKSELHQAKPEEAVKDQKTESAKKGGESKCTYCIKNKWSTEELQLFRRYFHDELAAEGRKPTCRTKIVNFLKEPGVASGRTVNSIYMKIQQLRARNSK